MENSNIKLSVVVPMYFEEEVVHECHRRLSLAIADFDYEILYINDGSTDNTLPILKEIASNDKRIKIVSFSRNFGHQAAVTAGIKYAKGDCIVIIDADLQDPPELIPDMVELWKQGYEVVYAQRKKRKGESVFKRISAKVFYKLLSSLTDTEIPNDTGDFRLIDKKVANAFKQMGEHNRFIRGMVAWLGFKQIPIEYVRDVRFAGETKYPLKKMIKLALDGIMSFSVKPLKLVINLGALTLLFSLGIIVYVLISKFTGNALTEGWASTMVIITMLSGVQLISLGVVGGYVSRIYEESRNRPIYLVSEEINTEGKSDDN